MPLTNQLELLQDPKGGHDIGKLLQLVCTPEGEVLQARKLPNAAADLPQVRRQLQRWEELWGVTVCVQLQPREGCEAADSIRNLLHSHTSIRSGNSSWQHMLMCALS